MTPPLTQERKHELFIQAVEQFILHLVPQEEDLLIYKLEHNNINGMWNLEIPRRICIGEITHGNHAQEQIFRDQTLPYLEDVRQHFETFFGKYAHKTAHGQVVAEVRLVSLAQSDVLLWGDIEIEYGPLSDYPPFPLPKNTVAQVDSSSYHRLHAKYDALIHRNYMVEQELERVQQDLDRVQLDLSRHVRHMTTMLERWHVMWDDFHRRNRVKHAHIQRILMEWYINRTTREDCCVCWQSIEPDAMTIPQCGHFICSPCHEQCSQCPLCRDSFHEQVTVDAIV